MVRNQLETFWKDIHLARGYDLLYTPHIAKVDLWKTSGHFEHYGENMFDQMRVRILAAAIAAAAGMSGTGTLKPTHPATWRAVLRARTRRCMPATAQRGHAGRYRSACGAGRG